MEAILIFLHVIALLACAFFFFRAADLEGKPGLPWALLSAAVYIITPTFGWSVIAKLIGQVLLFVLMGVMRAIFSQRKEERLEHERRAVQRERHRRGEAGTRKRELFP